MDRQTFLDAQSWLRRLDEDEFQWPEITQRPREGVRQLLPPTATPADARSSRPSQESPTPAAAVSCSGCFQQASRICYFRVADVGEDQTMLRVEMAAVERRRGGPGMLLVRFDQKTTFEIAVAAVQSVVLPIESEPHTTAKLPPFGELDFGSVRLRLWLEPHNITPQDARVALDNALRRVETLRSEELLRRQDKVPTSDSMHQVFRHNPWIQSARAQTSTSGLLSSSELLARGVTVLKSSSDRDTLKTIVGSYIERKRKRDAEMMARRRREGAERSSEEGVSEEAIESAQRDPESEGSDPLSPAESFDLLTSLVQAFGDSHTGLQRLLQIRGDSECTEHEACSTLPHDTDSSCVLHKWRKWDDFLQLTRSAFATANKRQRVGDITSVTSDSDALVLEAGKTMARAMLGQQDVEVLEASHAAATRRLSELEDMAFKALFPKPKGVPVSGERPPRTPVAPRRSQPTPTPTPPPPQNDRIAHAEHVLDLLVESRRALVRRELTTRCLPRRAHAQMATLDNQK